MRFFRVAWVVLAVIVLGLDAAGIPYAYAQYESVCTRAAEVCSEDSLLTPEGVRELGEIGLSRSFYAAYQGVGVDTAFTLVCFAVAVVIFSRRSDDRMALFTSFLLLIFGGAGAAGTMHDLADVYPALLFPVNLLDYVSQICFGIFFYLFPDGRFVPRWTRFFAVLSLPLFVLDIFFPDSFATTQPLFFVFVGSLVIAQVYRYRRVSTPEQRQQTKWVVFGVAAALAGFIALVMLTAFVSAVRDAGPLGVMAVSTIIYGFLLLIPLSIGVAILRSRLYDIDVVINRTLVYGTLTISLALVYVVAVAGSQYAFRSFAGGDSQLVVVASTLMIAALFVPLRRRIQAFIDRRFYRKKYDSAKTLAAFSARLRDASDLGRLNDDLMGVVRETVQPAHVSLWLREPGRGPKEERP